MRWAFVGLIRARTAVESRPRTRRRPRPDRSRSTELWLSGISATGEAGSRVIGGSNK